MKKGNKTTDADERSREEGKGRKSIELGLISHAEELELDLVGSWEPLERFKQVNYMIRFVY